MAQNEMLLGQYMHHQPFVNVASMGSYGDISGAMFYRNQWVGIEGAPETQGINILMPIGRKNHIGTTLVFDRIGVNQLFDASIDYAFSLRMSRESILTFGISAMVQSVDSRYGDLENITQNDPIYNTELPSHIAPNFKLGAFYFTKDYYIGIAVPKFLDNYLDEDFNPRSKFQFSELHLFINAGYKYKWSHNWDLYASTMIKYIKGTTPYLDLTGQTVYKKKISLGLSFRSTKEIMTMLTYSISKELRIGYSYENGFNDFSRNQEGSHEIMLIFELGEKNNCNCSTPRF